jgi:hypothetical protein
MRFTTTAARGLATKAQVKSEILRQPIYATPEILLVHKPLWITVLMLSMRTRQHVLHYHRKRVLQVQKTTRIVRENSGLALNSEGPDPEARAHIPLSSCCA